MMWWYGNGISGWGMALMMIGNVLFWALIILGAVALVRYLAAGNRTRSSGPGPLRRSCSPSGSPGARSMSRSTTSRLDTLTHDTGHVSSPDRPRRPSRRPGARRSRRRWPTRC